MSEIQIQTVLSTREAQVLRLSSEGKSAKEIARVLALSVNTVKVHLKVMRYKIGAKNVAHAVAIAARSGLLGEVAQ